MQATLILLAVAAVLIYLWVVPIVRANRAMKVVSTHATTLSLITGIPKAGVPFTHEPWYRIQGAGTG